MSRLQAKSETSKTALVLIEKKGDEPRVDSRAIAAELGVRHANTLVLLERYKTDFEEFGHMLFETAGGDRDQGGGTAVRFALLNEAQSGLLLTYSKNTEQSRKLKKKLIHLFMKYRQMAERRASLSWQQERAAGKEVRHHLTSTLERFVDYARAQGSEHAESYFLNFSKLTNKRLGIEVPPKGATRDRLDAGMLRDVQTVEIVESAAVLEAMSAGVPYKDVYPLAKARVEALNVVELRPAETSKALAPKADDGEMLPLFGEETA